MRALPASVVLSSLVLGGWLPAVEAQNLNPGTQPGLNPAACQQAGGSANLPPGVIAQPSAQSPGVVAGVTVGELYTDNLTLAAQGTPKQSSWITEIQPFIRAATNGPRFCGMVDYKLSGYLYSGGSSNNQLAHDLDANGTLTILPQHLFLDGYARYGRETINQRLPSGSGAFFVDNNHANVAAGTLSPYWLQDLGKVGTMTLRYAHGRVVYNDRGIPGQSNTQLNGVPNVTSDAAQFSLVSPNYQTWGWNLEYSEQRLDPDFGSGIEFARAMVGASYQLNVSTRLLADAGKETKFLPDGTTEKLGAPFWDAGFEWSNTRDSFKVMVGHRFFGRSWQLSWTHQAARLTTNVSYVERPTTYNQQLLGLNSGTGGLPPVTARPIIPSLNQRGPYLSKRLSASAIYTMPTSTLSVRAYDERRTYFQQNNAQERVTSADVAWLFNLGAFTTLTPGFNWQRYRFQDGSTRSTRYAQLALVHQFNPENFGGVQLRHESNDVQSGLPGARSDRVNVVFVQWTHLF